MRELKESLLQLITETSTNLPPDVRHAIAKAKKKEDAGTRAALALTTITDNIQMAEDKVSPICQDTGMPTFYIRVPVGVNQMELTRAIREAIVEATKTGKLRPNSVDSLTGENSGDNLGEGVPVIHYEQWEKDEIEVRLILKGGGCENKNIQYSLPCELEGLGRAGRDLDGIRKCILHSVYQAQGQGCSAGFIGVGIGGDRTTGYELAKKQLFRKTDDTNPHPDLARLEDYILDKANQLSIGTMGFGGNTTLLGCKIGSMHRIPASFYVSVAYNCWAFRRQGITLDPTSGKITGWLYKDEPKAETVTEPAEPPAAPETATSSREVRLTPPISEADIRSLRVGDVVILDGIIHTGRDALHKYLIDHDAPVDLTGGVIYHCGPVMLKNPEGGWEVKAAGPTTSIREEPYQADIIKKFGIRAVIGKGGMGARTLQGLKEHGAVYLNAIGGAAQYYADCITGVEGVHFMNFGVPEAMWHLRVKNFAAIVTMDAHGNSLHKDIEMDSLEKLAQFKEPVFS
ncbi:fumarate hydratase [Kroppenstedtia eburnea]|uniref:Fumarate hydratase class I n=1 Tax=Kroppenstedtia eburnea TaxID=714067 RepID=A0A1N7M0Y5_9BACL|nr:fumarate hydratase [Kroppenstedtia eburnea]QKI81758.1 fumarate hydratase [Kroppenstedtia eburnea]SIS79591.1 fumarase, class I, homodimeric [Kroppenstedtia eburnea]